MICPHCSNEMRKLNHSSKFIYNCCGIRFEFNYVFEVGNLSLLNKYHYNFKFKNKHLILSGVKDGSTYCMMIEPPYENKNIDYIPLTDGSKEEFLIIYKKMLGFTNFM